MSTRKTPEIVKTRDLTNMKTLVERVGTTEAGQLLGLAGETISQGLRENEMRLAYEMAAELVIRKMSPEQSAGRTYVVKLTADQVKIMKPLIETLGIQYLELDF